MYIVKDIDKLIELTGKTSKELINLGIIKTDTVKKDVELAFEKVWKLYPRKDGKKQALKHFNAGFNKYGLKVVDMITKAINLYLETPRDIKYTKAGSTFFNDWENYFEQWKENNLTRETKCDIDDIIT